MNEKLLYSQLSSEFDEWYYSFDCDQSVGSIQDWWIEKCFELLKGKQLSHAY